MKLKRLFLQAVVAGSGVGLMALELILRLNPSAARGWVDLMRAAALWALWGTVVVGSMFALFSFLLKSLAGFGSLKSACRTLALFLAAAALLAWVNARLFRDFLSGSGHRLLGQDAVAYALGAIIVAAMSFGSRSVCWAGVVLAALIPLERVAVSPTPAYGQKPCRPIRAEAAPTLVVVGIEGLDVNFILQWWGESGERGMGRVLREAAWGSLTFHGPYRRTAIWSTVATGALPASTGVLSSKSWSVWGLAPNSVQLLPWTPIGSRLFLPPGASSRPTSESRVCPAWEILEPKGGCGGWPGPWECRVPEERMPSPIPQDLVRSLIQATEYKGHAAQSLADAVQRDGAAVAWLSEKLSLKDAKGGAYFIALKHVALLRRWYEPAGAGSFRERAVMELGRDLIDCMIDRVLDGWEDGSVVLALVSPYGMTRPEGWESVTRFFLGKPSSGAYATTSVPGFIAVMGSGVQPGLRFGSCSAPDVLPTLLYLAGLPIPSFVEGRVILEALDPAFVASHPLLVSG